MPSKANVRKTGAEEGITELAQSIAAHGLRQNLNVRETDKGRFEVVAGGRCLRALKLLVKEGLMAKVADIPCKVMAEGEDAAETCHRQGQAQAGHRSALPLRGGPESV